MDIRNENQTEQFLSDAVLDKKDLEILRLLQMDAKLSVRDIANKIHLSTTPTHERIKRLEKSGVIRQYVALIDHRKVKKSIMAICNVSMNDHNKKTSKAFIDAISGYKEVIECYNISGQYDFMLKVLAGSMEAYHQFYMNLLSEIKGIGHIHSIFVMDVIKDTHEVI
jgi:Lrp/AsnC family transcriptional regulator, leucine-responsive regulatory protein